MGIEWKTLNWPPTSWNSAVDCEEDHGCKHGDEDVDEGAERPCGWKEGKETKGMIIITSVMFSLFFIPFPEEENRVFYHVYLNARSSPRDRSIQMGFPHNCLQVGPEIWPVPDSPGTGPGRIAGWSETWSPQKCFGPDIPEKKNLKGSV